MIPLTSAIRPSFISTISSQCYFIQIIHLYVIRLIVLITTSFPIGLNGLLRILYFKINELNLCVIVKLR